MKFNLNKSELKIIGSEINLEKEKERKWVIEGMK